MASPDPRQTSRNRTLRGAGLAALVFLLIASLEGTGSFLDIRVPLAGGGPRPWSHAVILSLADWLSLVPLFFVILALVARAPLEPGRWGGSLLRHGCAILVLAVPQQVLSQSVALLTNALLTNWATAMALCNHQPYRTVLPEAFWFPVFYLQMAGALYAWAYRRREQEKERRALALEHQLAQTQLAMLRAQLDPHFLFNALNSVATLMRRDVDAAEETLLALTDFLRATLEDGGLLEASLRRELELVQRYFDIERVRFQDRLALEVEVAPEALDLKVPALLLQPLVENAVRHGLAPRASGGRIYVRAALDGSHLLIEVEDDGLGAFATGHGGHGLGLKNLRERLAQQYGGAACLEAGPMEHGFRVRLSLPRNQVRP